MKFKNFLESSEGHKGDEEDDFLKTTPLKDLSKMLHAVEITLRAPDKLDEVDYAPTKNDDVTCWFEWSQYITVDYIATTREKAVAAAKKSADKLIEQGCKLMHARYHVRDLAHERRLGSNRDPRDDPGPHVHDITLD